MRQLGAAKTMHEGRSNVETSGCVMAGNDDTKLFHSTACTIALARCRPHILEHPRLTSTGHSIASCDDLERPAGGRDDISVGRLAGQNGGEEGDGVRVQQRRDARCWINGHDQEHGL